MGLKMIKHICTLRDEYQNKEIYIWNTGRRAMWVFSRLAFRLIRISGFVSEHEQFCGEEILHSPVVSLNELKDHKQAVLVCEANDPEADIERLSAYCPCVRLPELFDLNNELFERNVFIYGIGNNAWKLIKCFSDAGLSIRGFFQTKKEQNAVFGLPLRDFSEAVLSKEDALVISTVAVNEVLSHIQNCGFQGDVYLEELIRYDDIWVLETFVVIDKALREGRRILLCCEDAMTRELLHAVFSLYGISIAREVCMEGDLKADLDDIYSLAEEDAEQSTLIVHSFLGHERLAMAKAAADMGFSAEKLNCTGLYHITYNMKYYTNQLKYEPDQRIGGVSIDYSRFGGLPGWSVYGNPNKASVRIMVLGGSTSSEVYEPENWVSRLYSLLLMEGINCVIYNGAHEANKIETEMRRMCRDICFLKPDIVISMSGLNNTELAQDPFDQLRGETPFEYWRRTEFYMKQIAEFEGAAFFAFLQPVNTCMPSADFSEYMYFIASSFEIGRQFLKDASDGDFYTNQAELFFHKEGMYIDPVHYSNAGNQVIAEAVFQKILPDIKNRSVKEE